MYFLALFRFVLSWHVRFSSQSPIAHPFMLQFFQVILLEINLVVGRVFCFEVVSHHLPEPLGGPAVSRKRPQLEIFRTCLVSLGRDRQGKRMEIQGEYIFGRPTHWWDLMGFSILVPKEKDAVEAESTWPGEALTIEPRVFQIHKVWAVIERFRRKNSPGNLQVADWLMRWVAMTQFHPILWFHGNIRGVSLEILHAREIIINNPSRAKTVALMGQIV